MTGYVAGPSPVGQVMVNGVEADTFPADYRPYGTPTGYTTVGFRVPLIIGPQTAVNVTMMDGQLAWRQHDGGHTDGPNWKYFIAWCDKFFNLKTPAAKAAAVKKG